MENSQDPRALAQKLAGGEKASGKTDKMPGSNLTPEELLMSVSPIQQQNTPKKWGVITLIVFVLVLMIGVTLALGSLNHKSSDKNNLPSSSLPSVESNNSR